jgi:AcrR family transcriptional regulator
MTSAASAARVAHPAIGFVGCVDSMENERLVEQSRGKKVRPGGRTERIRKTVADAVIQLIEREGIEFEIQAVVRLSGVGRATIFRRWPDRASLIGEALAEHISHFEVAITGNWEEDLRRVAIDLQTFFAKPSEQAFNRTLFATNSSDFSAQMTAYWAPIINKIKAPLEAARLIGEIDENTDVEAVVQMLACTLVIESLVPTFSNKANLIDILISQLRRGLVPGRK